jgi:hypothetical protein
METIAYQFTDEEWSALDRRFQLAADAQRVYVQAAELILEVHGIKGNVDIDRERRAAVIRDNQ